MNDDPKVVAIPRQQLPDNWREELALREAAQRAEQGRMKQERRRNVRVGGPVSGYGVRRIPNVVR